MSGVAKSPGKSTSFQYGLLLGTRDAETWSPPLWDPLICDKSSPCILIILFQLQNPIPTPNCIHIFFLPHIFMCSQTLPVFSRICLFKVILYFVEILIVIQMYQIFNCCRHDVAHVSLVKLPWFGVFQHSWHSIAKRQSRKERIWTIYYTQNGQEKSKHSLLCQTLTNS